MPHGSKRMATRRSAPASHCVACGTVLGADGVSVAALRPGLQAAIAAAAPSTSEARPRICARCLETQRLAFTTAALEEERGELSAVERAVANKAALHETIAQDLDEEFAKGATAGQHLADAVARVGGSWPFVASFFALLVVWMAINTWLLASDAFDPYPYILLNLVLSCVAAMQAPVIMMSQNRVSQRDRAQADHDFRINLKAELEIAALHDKVDHLLHSRWEHLVELQTAQLEMLETLLARRDDVPAVD